MLAPMQGLTNRAFRAVIIGTSRPDVVFTEFMRVRLGSKKGLSKVDKVEAASHNGDVPLVAQLIGRDPDALVAAAKEAQQAGARHLNINMGCPYGRMNSNSAGGALLKDPQSIPVTLERLRREIKGSFSVKLRAGYDDPRQALDLLPIFEDIGIDFIIIHPRTVIQKFTGLADHRITAELVSATRLPVIANGDIMTAADGRQILVETKAAGLMLGRGAITDPLLFERIRGNCPAEMSRPDRALELKSYIRELLERYQEIFQGEDQILRKTKEVISFIEDPWFEKYLKKMRRAADLTKFAAHAESIA
ncbi:MAG: tRNA-dihydrouridine synthase family protein [Proteobacteria bacterium]|nr:tRNA-dihydrouridine synthase family protein [Pseudomonadota bacterium]MBU1716549.1 tRNA-dihydrouridine synthase family protein [Pseudomonadota bacterium]